MKYTAQGKSHVANVAQAKPSAIFVMRLSPRAVLSYKQSGSALSILLYFTLKDVLTKDTPLNLLNKQMGFFDKMCQ